MINRWTGISIEWELAIVVAVMVVLVLCGH